MLRRLSAALVAAVLFALPSLAGAQYYDASGNLKNAPQTFGPSVSTTFSVTANGTAATATLAGQQSCSIRVGSVGGGATLAFNVSSDGTNYAAPLVGSASVAAAGQYIVSTSSMQSIQVVVSAYVSGTVSGSLNCTGAPYPGGAVSLATLPSLPAGSALVGKFGLDQTTPGTTNAVADCDKTTPANCRAVDASGRAPIARVATRITGLASGTYTATQTGSALTVGLYTECAVLTSITAASGTSPTWATTVDSSLDGGTTWINGVATGPNLTAVSTQLVSIGAGSANSAQSAGAFGDTIRVRVVIGGTTPSFTGQVVLVCK